MTVNGIEQLQRIDVPMYPSTLAFNGLAPSMIVPFGQNNNFQRMTDDIRQPLFDGLNINTNMLANKSPEQQEQIPIKNTAIQNQ